MVQVSTIRRTEDLLDEARQRVDETYRAHMAAVNDLAILTRQVRAEAPKVSGQRRVAYRVAEVAKMLGVSHDSVQRAINRGDLKGIRIGGVTLILVSDLEAYLDELRGED